VVLFPLDKGLQMSNKVKYYHSGMRGAPIKNGTPGSWITVLDAVFVNGFGQVNAVSANITNGMVIINLNNNESFDIDTTVLVTGASVLSVNGENTVTVSGSNFISWPTIEPDGPITGTITIKVAPLGFTKQFSGVSLAAYKMMNPLSSGAFFRIDDTSAFFMQVAAYENMLDINSGSNRTPALTYNSGICVVPKSDTANTTATLWEIIGDDSGFYISTQVSTYSVYANYRCILYFGDGIPDNSNDSFKIIVNGLGTTTSYSDNWSASIANAITQNTNTNCINRSANGLNTSIPIKFYHMAAGSGYSGGGSMINGKYPSITNNGLILAQYQYNDEYGRRGIVPGILSCTQIAMNHFTTRNVIDGQQQFIGKRLLAINPGSSSANNAGVVFFDITGPWR